MLNSAPGESIAPTRVATRNVAVGFYSRLLDEGFTHAQIIDVSLRLLDEVASGFPHGKHAELPLADLPAAK